MKVNRQTAIVCFLVLFVVPLGVAHAGTFSSSVGERSPAAWQEAFHTDHSLPALPVDPMSDEALDSRRSDSSATDAFVLMPDSQPARNPLSALLSATGLADGAIELNGVNHSLDSAFAVGAAPIRLTTTLLLTLYTSDQDHLTPRPFDGLFDSASVAPVSYGEFESPRTSAPVASTRTASVSAGSTAIRTVSTSFSAR